VPLSRLSEPERHCLERYVAHLANTLGDELEEVVVFGSAARGEMWPNGSPMRSDIDLLVVTSTPVDGRTESELVDATYPLFLECGRQLGPQFRTRGNVGPLAAALARDGVTLWRRSAAG
jgi:predicted nucleotidyltransferase